MIRRLLLCFALLLAALSSGQYGAVAQSADVIVRGGDHDGFGRIAFDWPSSTAYEVRLEGGELVVTFAESGRFALATLEGELKDYIEAPRPEGDGRTLRIRLKGDYGLRHYVMGTTVVIDLLDSAPGRDTAAAAPPAPSSEANAVPAAPADPPQPNREAGPRVPLRVGEHDGFSRLVFDWPQEVPYRVEESPGQITVRFGRPGRLDLAQYRRSPPPQVTALVPRVTAEGAAVELAVPNGAGLRHFVDNGHVVIDVLAPGVDATVQPAPRASAVPLPAGKPASKTAEKEQESAQSEQESARLEQAAAATTVEAGEDRAAQATAVPKPQKKPTQLLPNSQSADTDDPSPGDSAKSEGRTPDQAAEAPAESVSAPEEDSQTADDQGSDTAGPATAAEGASAPTENELVAANPAPQVVAEVPAPGRTTSLNRPIALRFNWTEPVAAAAFRRAGRLWLVFDRPVETSIVDKIVEAAPALAPADQLAHDGATIIRLTAPPTYSAVLKPDNNDWVVDLRQRDDLGMQPLDIEIDRSTGETRLRVPLEGPGRLVALIDPDLGSELFVVPLRAPQWGVDRPRSLPELRVIESYQGLVFEALADGLQVEIVEDAALVSTEGGLQASDAELRKGRRSPAPLAADGRRLFDLEAWRGDGPYLQRKQALQRAVVETPPGGMDLARLDLARFFFAHGLATESLGVLRLTERQASGAANDPQVLLMRGASELLAHQHEAAARNLLHVALDEEWEAQPWRGALAALGEDWPTAARLFSSGDPLVEAYATPVRHRLWLLAAKARLAIGDGGGAVQYLDLVTRDDPNALEKAQVAFLEGKRLALEGDLGNAKAAWREVALSAHATSAARARLALIELELEQGILSTADAIGELERLRFAWRGDEFEFALLERLADLYLSRGHARDALMTMRHAASYLPSSPRAKTVAQRMREAFADLFLGEAGKQLPPIKALALYEEFKELTPGGKEGDAVIAGLADRLVEVDLLAQAAELLETQLQFRLQGLDKARTGAQTALLYLMDERPAEAFDVLARSDVDPIPAELAQERRLLRAQALADTDRQDEALALLASGESEAALRLRAEILWSAQQWVPAAAALQALLPQSPPGGMALSDEQAGIVASLAVAYTLAGDRGRLRDLEWNYARSMAATPQASTFAMLTKDLEAGSITSIADELEGIQTIQAFMANYRERIQEKGLSKVN